MSVRRGKCVAMGGDGQVTLGNVVFKATARKVRRVFHDRILVGFAGATADAFTLLERFELKDRENFFPFQLSGGQRRRAMAARALIHKPQLILADEPTNDLDEHWAEEIICILKEQAAQGAAVVMVTHNPLFAGQADRRYRLENGLLINVMEETKEDPKHENETV